MVAGLVGVEEHEELPLLMGGGNGEVVVVVEWVIERGELSLEIVLAVVIMVLGVEGPEKLLRKDKGRRPGVAPMALVVGALVLFVKSARKVGKPPLYRPGDSTGDMPLYKLQWQIKKRVGWVSDMVWS